MQSSNPAFRDYNRPASSGQAQGVPTADDLRRMYDQPSYLAPAQQRPLTLDDVVTRTAVVLGVGIIAAVVTIYFTSSWAVALPAMLIAFVLSLVIIFKRSTNPALILTYSAAEGVMLGAITAAFENVKGYEGIGLQALVATFGVFAGMLIVYKTGAIRVTPKFTKFMIGAMIGVLVLVVFRLLASTFGFAAATFNGGPMSIIISLVIIGVAAFTFLLDFDQIDRAIKAGVPAKTAWYFGFSLMVTLVWLYLEILRLLAAFRD